MNTQMAHQDDVNEGARREAVKRLARSVLTAERILMGLMFVGFGVNGFLGVLPTTLAHDGSAALGSALMKASYLFPLLKGTEVLLEVYVKPRT